MWATGATLFTFKIRQHAERRRRSLWETREMSSILRDKSPALPSTACPWSSRCNPPHTGSESVTHRPWDARTHWNAKKKHIPAAAIIKHTTTGRSQRLLCEHEVKRSDWNRAFYFAWLDRAYVVTLLLSGRRWLDTALYICRCWFITKRIWSCNLATFAAWLIRFSITAFNRGALTSRDTESRDAEIS